MRITNKEIIFLLIGMLLSTFSYFLIGSYTKDDSLIKTLFPSFMTGTLGLTALVITYVNNAEQRKVLLITTIHKEFVDSARSELSSMILESTDIASISLKYGGSKIDEAEDIEKYNNAQFKFKTSQANLKLLLNVRDNLENGLYEKCQNLYKLANDKDISVTDFDNYINEMVELAHTIFESRTALK